MKDIPQSIQVFELLNISAEGIARDLSKIANDGGKIISVYKTTRYSHHIGEMDCFHAVVDVRDMNTEV